MGGGCCMRRDRGRCRYRRRGRAGTTSAFLDLLGDPAQLGLLRARGLITAGTVTAVAFADHRVPSEAELRRRCGFWGAIVRVTATGGRGGGRGRG